MSQKMHPAKNSIILRRVVSVEDLHAPKDRLLLAARHATEHAPDS